MCLDCTKVYEICMKNMRLYAHVQQCTLTNYHEHNHDH